MTRKIFTIITFTLFIMLGCAILCTYVYALYGIEPDSQNKVPPELVENLVLYRIKAHWVFISYLLITIVYLLSSRENMK